jgi:hypothetical protein
MSEEKDYKKCTRCSHELVCMIRKELQKFLNNFYLYLERDWTQDEFYRLLARQCSEYKVVS